MSPPGVRPVVVFAAMVFAGGLGWFWQMSDLEPGAWLLRQAGRARGRARPRLAESLDRLATGFDDRTLARSEDSAEQWLGERCRELAHGTLLAAFDRVESDVRVRFCSQDSPDLAEARLPRSYSWLESAGVDFRRAITTRELNPARALDFGRVVLAPIWGRLHAFGGLFVYWDASLPPLPIGAISGPTGDSLRLSHRVVVAPFVRDQSLADSPSSGWLIVSGDRSVGAQLRGAQAESEWLASHFEQPVQLGPNPSEAELARAVSRARSVHFALHSGTDRGGQPALELTSAGAGARPEVDGYWSLQEIREHHWPRLEVVVLAGCRTAVGARRLTDAFVSAGAKRVLGSMWDVNDVVTAEWMRVFYRALSEGQPPEVAAAEAEFWFAAGEAGSMWTEPYYWAGFALRSRPYVDSRLVPR